MKSPSVRWVSAEYSRQSYAWQFIRGALFAQLVLFATWNHSGYSYISWVAGASHFTPLMGVAGIALVIAYIVMLRITYVALGYPGLFAASVFITAVLLLLWQLNLIDLDQLTRHLEFWLFIVACLLSIGIAWAKYQQRLSGQRDVLKAPP